MATYNGEKYLKEQLESILNQSYHISELIIVDDCSSDATMNILNKYSTEHSCIKIYRNDENIGSARSFFKGLGLCSGDFIAFADQDDVWVPNKLEILLRNIEDNLLIHSDAFLIKESGEIIANSHFNSADKHQNTDLFNCLLKNNVTGCCALISRKILSNEIVSDFYIHDHYFALLAAALNKSKFIPNKLVYYRQHANNVIGAKKPSYEKFISNSKVVADSYVLLLHVSIFKQQSEIIRLVADYRRSIANQSFIGWSNLIKVFNLPGGINLVGYYFLVGGMLGRKMSQKIYNFIHGL